MICTPGKSFWCSHQVGGLELVHGRVDRHQGERIAPQALLHLGLDRLLLQPQKPRKAVEKLVPLDDGDGFERSRPDLHEVPARLDTSTSPSRSMIEPRGAITPKLRIWLLLASSR